MEFVIGMLVGGILLALTLAIRNARELKKDLQDEEYRQQRKKMYEAIEANSSSEPYRFSVTRDEQGWRWEILRHYVSRGLIEDYVPMNYRGYGEAIFGYEDTQENALKVGKTKCEELTQVYRWKQEKQVYSLDNA